MSARKLREMAAAVAGRRPKLAWAAVDCGIAAAVAVLLVAGVSRTPASSVPGASGSVGDILALLAAAGVAVRRLAPVPVLAAVLAVSVASAYLGFAKDPMIAVAVLLYTVAAAAPVGTAVVVLVIAEIGAGVAAQFPVDAGNLLPRLVLTAVVQLAAWTVGLAVRTQRRYAAGLREQAERRVQAEADRSRRALAEERLRIARELHDVVAHSMGVIAVQAGVGGHVALSRPQEAGEALRAIEETSRSALQELRRMLTVLRDDSSAPHGAAADLLPAPGLADLPGLIDRTAATGLRVELSEGGEPGRLAEGVGLAAFRIVQEALANVVRHAARADHACVRLEHEPAGLRITVTDNGIGVAGPDAPAEGHGLQGMRERAALCSGDFSAGPRPGGGYEVHAFLPAIPAAGAAGDAVTIRSAGAARDAL